MEKLELVDLVARRVREVVRKCEEERCPEASLQKSSSEKIIEMMTNPNPKNQKVQSQQDNSHVQDSGDEEQPPTPLEKILSDTFSSVTAHISQIMGDLLSPE
eukprot:TRINITY_DN809_c0_g1_i2.p1 TRINITY_DN809_c0_g1~~TRINITY_DN809_c0_g1_i2.p1  ORF type:complete len:102 (+),score=22.28 TRINITY_DN809_c0_g1_i2:636-941(+)